MLPQPLFQILGHQVTWYHVIYVLALFPAIGLGLWQVRRRGASLQLGLDGAMAAVLGGWLGGRLLSMLQWPILEGSRPDWQGLWAGGGQASMGALLGILVGLGLFFRFSPRVANPRAAFDVVVPGLALYEAVARIGCFTAGCCHGSPAAGLAWAVTFTHPGTACSLPGVPLHPAQLYLSAGDLVLAAILVFLFVQGERFRGRLLAVYLVGYGVLRFSVEFVRADYRPFVGVLSLNQWICLGFVVVGAWVFYREGREGREG